MKVLVATQPSTDHFSAARPVVEELLCRGHEVVWMTGLVFKDKVLHVGARFVPMSEAALVGDDGDDGDDNDDDDDTTIARIPAQINDLHRAVMGTVAAEAAGIPRYTLPGNENDDDSEKKPEWPPFPADVLVVDSYSPYAHAARCFSDLTGTPYTTLGTTSPLVTLDPEIPPRGSGRQPPTTRLGLWRNQCRHWKDIYFSIARPSAALNKVRRQLGLRPRSRWRSYADDARSPDLHIQTTTPLFEFPRKRLPPSVLFVGPLLSKVQAVRSGGGGVSGDDKTANYDDADDWPMPPWWVELLNRPRERVVYIIAQGTATQLIKSTVAALADREDLLVIVTGKNADALFEQGADADAGGGDGDDRDAASTTGLATSKNHKTPRLKRPANVRTAAFVPHLRLLPHVGVVVTDASCYSSTLAALSCGVPLVCAPRSGDSSADVSADVSSRVAWSGAGIDLGLGMGTAAPTAEELRAAVLRIVEAGLGGGSSSSRRSSAALSARVRATEATLPTSSTAAAAATATAMAAIDRIHGPDHNYRAAAKHIRDDFGQHRAPAEAANALECLVLRKKTGRRISHGPPPRRSSLKVPTLSKPPRCG